MKLIDEINRRIIKNNCQNISLKEFLNKFVK